MKKDKSTTRKPATAGRRPTPAKDCELIGASLPDASTLFPRIKQAAADLIQQHEKSTLLEYSDGTHICLRCGFPLPYPMQRCPNCGTVHQASMNKKERDALNYNRTAYVTELSLVKGATDKWLLQRQFVIDVCYLRESVQQEITEVYRNFVSSDGKTIISFKRALNPFPYYMQNPYRADTPIKLAPKDRYNNGLTAAWCPLNWDHLLNENLLKDLHRRLKRRTKN